MNWFGRVLANFGLVRGVAKPTDPLIVRADEVIENVKALRVVVIPKEDLKAVRRLEAVARHR